MAAVLPLAGQNNAQQPPSSRDAQPQVEAAAGTVFPALLVSDIHFDPFFDPSKVRALAAAPVSQWSTILEAPPSPDQARAFQALQQQCQVSGVDTSYALLRSAIQAMRARQPDAAFLVATGDLVAHSLQCRYTALVPGSTQQDFQAFVMKTFSFVIGELRAAFPGMPVYTALGNNDSACGNYRADPGSDFLVQAGKAVVEGLPSSERKHVMASFTSGGHYSLMMGAPLRGLRLIVVNDILLASNYVTCSGKRDAAPGAAEIAWLEAQLKESRRLNQKAWVVGHIPPGIDPYSTARHLKDICGNQSPEMFLSSDRLADLLIEYADVVRLGVFGHTHMDELRLLETEGATTPASSQPGVAVKVVASISPAHGNNPSFTIARVDGASGMLQGYEVIAASNQTGIAATWSREYDYGQSYRKAQFSASAVRELIAEFAKDRRAATAVSQAYIRNYYVRDLSPQLTPFWPFYACSFANHSAKAFAACVCSAAE